MKNMQISMEAARADAKLTQAEAALILGISRNTYANYENGKTHPSLEMAQKIAETFGRTLDQIKFRK